MMYLETQEGSRNIFRADMKRGIYVALVSVALIAGMISVARPAHAQGARQSEESMQANSNASFGPNFPFGYGGGPRGPNPPVPPNAAAIVTQVIARINAMLDRLFNR